MLKNKPQKWVRFPISLMHMAYSSFQQQARDQINTGGNRVGHGIGESQLSLSASN
jgi:hypothetical protein